MSAEIPQAVATRCPECAEETLHRVLHGRVGTRGGLTLDATVECDACGRVHHVVLREAPPVEIPVVISRGAESERTRVELPGDDGLHVGDEMIVAGTDVLLTGIELKDGRRVPAARADEVGTLWVKFFESVRVRVAINMRKKTIAKALHADPGREFHVGQELLFGRLRVTIHGIKVHGGMRRRGSAEARDVVTIFAKPTRGETLSEAPPPPEAEGGPPAPRPERASEDVEAEAGDAWEELEEDET